MTALSRYFLPGWNEVEHRDGEQARDVGDTISIRVSSAASDRNVLDIKLPSD